MHHQLADPPPTAWTDDLYRFLYIFLTSEIYLTRVNSLKIVVYNKPKSAVAKVGKPVGNNIAYPVFSV